MRVYQEDVDDGAIQEEPDYTVLKSFSDKIECYHSP